MVRTLEVYARIRPSPSEEIVSQPLCEDSWSQQIESLDAKELGPSRVKNIMIESKIAQLWNYYWIQQDIQVHVPGPKD